MQTADKIVNADNITRLRRCQLQLRIPMVHFSCVHRVAKTGLVAFFGCWGPDHQGHHCTEVDGPSIMPCQRITAPKKAMQKLFAK